MKFPKKNAILFLVWIEFSLLAIAYIGEHPYIGLGIAIVGGIILGVLSFLYYEEGRTAEKDDESAST